MFKDSLNSSAFAVADYVVFALVLLVSAAVGVYYAWADRGRQSADDFLMGGRRLPPLAVSMSLTASFMSAITMLSNPAEVYFYGANIIYFAVALLLTMVITSEIFLPVFYRLGITSTYEYLELRFNRATRLLGIVLFSCQTILYTGFVIYTPALALTQVTGINLWGAVISTGVVCTFYCTMGGLKAVVWTDVIQLGVMFTGFLAVIIMSVNLRGGIFPIVLDSQEGGRLNFWDFDTNPLRRHTFWTIAVGGTFVWLTIYGINQSQVQRYISCKTITQARLALYINLIGVEAIMLLSVFAGMCLYSFYKDCDPWTIGMVSAPDQLMPHLIMDILADYPGLPGLFVAAAYSGSLSTVSSSINALTTVTLEDLIKPYINMSERHLSWMTKGLSFAFGLIAIGMAGLVSLMGGILQAVNSIFGIIGGPLLGLFTLGFLCPFANSKGALSGLVSGLAVSLWLGIGAYIYPPPPELTRPLPLSTEGCNFTTTDSLNSTSTILPTFTTPFTTATDGIPVPVGNLYSLSYLYSSPVGTIIVVTVGLLISLCTRGMKQKVESRLTLLKEDTSLYHIAMLLKERAMKQKGKLDMAKDREKKFGNSNPAFCDIELDLRKRSKPT